MKRWFTVMAAMVTLVSMAGAKLVLYPPPDKAPPSQDSRQ